MKFRMLHLVLAAALVAAGGLGWWKLGAETPSAAPATSVAALGTVTRNVVASGMLEARQLVSVGARASGQIETLAVTLGQEVKAGDLIAQIDSRDQQNNLRQAEASLAKISAQISAKEATLARAQSVLTRQKELGASNYASKEAVESATADVLVLTADLEALRADRSSSEVTVASAKVALERTTITSPINGTVVAVVVKQGQTVNANQSTPTIVKIADLTTMIVKADISEADVMNVAPGQNVSFTTLGAPERPFRAVVKELEPAPAAISDSDTISSEQAIYYKALLEVDNAHGRLRIGMTAQVSIELGRAENVLTVPASALKREGRQLYVELWDGGARLRRDVKAGLNNKITVEIQEGLAAGDRVVTGQPDAATSGGNRGAGGGPGAGGRGGMRPPSMF